VTFYWITENRHVEITALAHYIWNLHEEDERKVLVYVAVEDWELEILLRILGNKCVLITHPTTA
jgi:hypothetical protein